MNSTAIIQPSVRRQFKGPLIVLAFTPLGLVACQTQGYLIQQENSLAAAGFTVHIANTAARHCLYVGSQQAFNQYVSNQQLDIAHEQQMAVQDYYDAAWDWAAWGPWGPLGPLYGPGIGGW